MSEYTTVTLTAIRDGDTVVLLDSRGVAITRIEAERAGRASRKALRRRAWSQWASRKAGNGYQAIRLKQSHDPWQAKAETWVISNKLRRQKASKRIGWRSPHDPFVMDLSDCQGDVDAEWGIAAGRMLGQARERERKHAGGEWDRWADTVRSNHARNRQQGKQA